MQSVSKILLQKPIKSRHPFNITNLVLTLKHLATTLEYELKVLEHIITVVLNPSNINPENLNDEFLGECKLHADLEKERIKKQFSLFIFSENEESRIKKYYLKHQAILLKLAETIFKYIRPAGLESIYRRTDSISIINFYKEVARIPEDLLDFIESNFPEYFNTETKIPGTKQLRKEPEIKHALKFIKKELGKFELENILIEITCSPFEDYLSGEKNITYKDLLYLKELQQELIYFIKRANKENTTDQLCLLLLYLNFNRLRFFNYYIQKIEETAKNCNSISEQIEFYSLKIKLINQQQVKPGLIFKSGLPSIKDQIGSWMCEELYYIEKRQQLLSKSYSQQSEENPAAPKIHTNLSVAQLALAVKLLVESKMIVNTNATELMRIVARNFKTDKQEVISEDSLRNKSYNFEATTVSKLKDEIIGLMNLARQY